MTLEKEIAEIISNASLARDLIELTRSVREQTIEECAKVADSCKLRAQQTYGVAESVGADMAARSIRRLALSRPDQTSEAK